jgi:hypothetical protein
MVYPPLFDTVPNVLFTGLAALQDSTVLKTTSFAPNRHFRGRFSQVRCNLGWVHWLQDSLVIVSFSFYYDKVEICAKL